MTNKELESQVTKLTEEVAVAKKAVEEAIDSIRAAHQLITTNINRIAVLTADVATLKRQTEVIIENQKAVVNKYDTGISRYE